jgi:hypothetical protein
MSRILNFILIFVLVFSFAVPSVSLAAEVKWDSLGFVNCGNDLNPITEDADGRHGGDVANPCDSFDKLLKVVNKVINFVLFSLIIPFAAIMFAYAGILLLTSGGNESQMKKAKKIFTNVLIGIVVALAAWLIVGTILSILSYGGVNFLEKVNIFN